MNIENVPKTNCFYQRRKNEKYISVQSERNKSTSERIRNS